MKYFLTILLLFPLFAQAQIPCGLGGIIYAKPAAAATVQWSSTHGSSVVISGGGATYTNSTTNLNCGIGNIGYSTGIHIFEVYYSAYSGSFSSLVGIAQSTVNTGSYIGSDTHGYGWYAYASTIYHNGSPGATIGTYGVGHYIEFVVNFTTGNVYGYNDGVITNSGNPIITGLSGTWFPAVGYEQDTWTLLNGNYATMAYPPAGYSTANNW